MDILNLNTLLVNNKSKFIVPFVGNPTDPSTTAKTLKFFAEFALKYNTVFTNVGALSTLDEESMDKITNALGTILDESKKDAWIFRKEFSTESELESYTLDDYMAIFAQYSITYGWAEEFTVFTSGMNPENVLLQYFASDTSKGARDFLASEKYIKSGRTIALEEPSYVKNLTEDVLTANVPLSTLQKSILKSIPADVVLDILGEKINIRIGETKAFALNHVKDVKGASNKIFDHYLNSPSEVVQFFAVPFLEDGEQINIQVLKRVRLHIPKSLRKSILGALENIGFNKSSQHICEDMFSHYNFWKRLDKYLRWGADKVMRRRYPHYMEAMDLLYKDDRSWTFNGRHSQAMQSGNFNKVACIAAEKPGFFMRGILNLMRMAETGSPLPVKAGNVDSGKVVTIGSSSFFSSDKFRSVVAQIPLKHLIQLSGLLRDKETLLSPITDRVTNGVPVSYIVPIPAVNEDLWRKVLGVVDEVSKNKLREIYDEKGSIFADDTTKSYTYSSSGRKSVDTSFSGEMLQPGSYIPIENILKQKNKILRLGVIWRGERSVDIDHSVGFSITRKGRGEEDSIKCYYGNPELEIDGKLLAVSSGDITECEPDKFSCEFIDVDIDLCRKSGVTALMSHIHNYSSGMISEVECYTFVKVIDKSDRVSPEGRDVHIDLSDTDYASSVSQNARAVNGFYMRLTPRGRINSGALYVINENLVSKNSQDVNGSLFEEETKAVEGFLNSKMSVYNVLSHSTIVEPANDCKFVVTTDPSRYTDFETIEILHPARDYDRIMSLVF